MTTQQAYRLLTILDTCERFSKKALDMLTALHNEERCTLINSLCIETIRVRVYRSTTSTMHWLVTHDQRNQVSCHACRINPRADVEETLRVAIADVAEWAECDVHSRELFTLQSD